MTVDEKSHSALQSSALFFFLLVVVSGQVVCCLGAPSSRALCISVSDVVC